MKHFKLACITLFVAVLLTQSCTNSASNRDLALHLIVSGYVTDSAGQPVENAFVQARLGLDLDGPVARTGADGAYRVEARSAYWYKGAPSVSVRFAESSDQYVYFERWDRGKREFQQDIVLKFPRTGAPDIPREGAL